MSCLLLLASLVVSAQDLVDGRYLDPYYNKRDTAEPIAGVNQNSDGVREKLNESRGRAEVVSLELSEMGDTESALGQCERVSPPPSDPERCTKSLELFGLSNRAIDAQTEVVNKRRELSVDAQNNNYVDLQDIKDFNEYKMEQIGNAGFQVRGDQIVMPGGRTVSPTTGNKKSNYLEAGYSESEANTLIKDFKSLQNQWKKNPKARLKKITNSIEKFAKQSSQPKAKKLFSFSPSGKKRSPSSKLPKHKISHSSLSATLKPSEKGIQKLPNYFRGATGKRDLSGKDSSIYDENPPNYNQSPKGRILFLGSPIGISEGNVFQNISNAYMKSSKK